MWTEIIADSLRQSGHHVDFIYHNRKTLTDRIGLAGKTLLSGKDRQDAWAQRVRRLLKEKMRDSHWDLLLSIQGKIDQQTVQQLRGHSPDLKVIFWWGDIVTDQALEKISRAAEFSDRLLVSYQGSFDKLKPVYRDKLVYFPFGISKQFHTVIKPTLPERKRFSAEVSLVGTCYPERCELVRYLNTQLDTPVKVWGRGWRHCRGIDGHGALSLQDSLRVYACSKISLNLHHVDTDNGFNMKHYEIPAAGGFQLCDWQPLLEDTALGRQTAACHSLPEFAEKIAYYLAHEQERIRIVETTSQTVFTSEDYPSKLTSLLNQ
jgi:spore maturation protein CgeB